jgi:hypothetical protein
MARKRMISPEFFSSVPVSRLPVTARLTFIGLWTEADDEGRHTDEARLLRGRLWALDSTMTVKKVQGDIDSLVAHGLLCRYNVAGTSLLHVPSWFEHQKISHPSASKLPPCAGHEPGLWEFFLADSGGPLERFRESSRKVHGGVSEASAETVPSVVKGSSDQIRAVVVQGESACRHGTSASSCFVCKRHETREVS